MFPFKRKQKQTADWREGANQGHGATKPKFTRRQAGACWGLRAQEEPFKRWGSVVQFPRVKEEGQAEKHPEKGFG